MLKFLIPRLLDKDTNKVGAEAKGRIIAGSKCYQALGHELNKDNSPSH
jgi:hypothetical protein